MAEDDEREERGDEVAAAFLLGEVRSAIGIKDSRVARA